MAMLSWFHRFPKAAKGESSTRTCTVLFCYPGEHRLAARQLYEPQRASVRFNLLSRELGHCG
jgi:hypothetical protein